jgi:hypothetical protein
MSAKGKLDVLKIQLGTSNGTLPNICSSKSKIKTQKKLTALSAIPQSAVGFKNVFQKRRRIFLIRRHYY